MSTACGFNGDLNGTGSCTACGKISEYKCDRCGDYYCSAKCQLKDWSSHRFICFPMPKLIKVQQDSVTNNGVPKLIAKETNSPKTANSLECAKSQKKVKFPSGSCVFLTAFKSSNRCFIRSTNPSSLEEQEKILNEIHDFGKTAPAFQPRPKNLVPALALRNEKWCRAQILSVKNNIFTISFTDFGDKCNRSLKDLRRSNSSINDLPCHIQMVQLKDINNFSTDQKLLNLLNEFTNKEYKIEYSRTGDLVELFKWGTSISLNALVQELAIKHDDNGIDNKSVVSTSNAREKKASDSFKNKRDSSGGKTFKINQASNTSTKEISLPANNGVDGSAQCKTDSSALRQTQKRCLTAPFDIIPLTEKDSGSRVLIMDNSFIYCGFIGCLLEKYCENLKKITDYLNNYDAGAQQPYKPQCNEYCLAKFDNLWYRAKVEEVLSDDKFLVIYIDFANENDLSSDSIRPYPLELDSPCCTTLCGIDGLPDNLPKELVEHLEEMLKSFTILKIDSIIMKEDICYLKSDDLMKKLRDSKLI